MISTIHHLILDVYKKNGAVVLSKKLMTSGKDATR